MHITPWPRAAGHEPRAVRSESDTHVRILACSPTTHGTMTCHPGRVLCEMGEPRMPTLSLYTGMRLPSGEGGRVPPRGAERAGAWKWACPLLALQVPACTFGWPEPSPPALLCSGLLSTLFGLLRGEATSRGPDLGHAQLSARPACPGSDLGPGYPVVMAQACQAGAPIPPPECQLCDSAQRASPLGPLQGDKQDRSSSRLGGPGQPSPGLSPYTQRFTGGSTDSKTGVSHDPHFTVRQTETQSA